MRSLTTLACCLFLFSYALGAEENATALSPEEAAKKVNEEIVLEMEVKSASIREGVCFLNSEEKYRSERNFTVFIERDALAKFKETKIEDPAAEFKGKRIRVQGKVTLHKSRPQIKVSGPESLSVVAPVNP